MSDAANDQDSIRQAIDYVAAGVTVATITSLLPSAAALFTIVWTGIRIWETDTIRGLTGRAAPPPPGSPE